MTFLCDTNIISELARPQPNPGVLTWSAQVSSISLSVITLEEKEIQQFADFLWDSGLSLADNDRT